MGIRLNSGFLFCVATSHAAAELALPYIFQIVRRHIGAYSKTIDKKSSVVNINRLIPILLKDFAIRSEWNGLHNLEISNPIVLF